VPVAFSSPAIRYCAIKFVKMSDDNPLAGSDIGSVHGDDLTIKNLGAVSSVITTIHSDKPSTAQNHEDGEEIIAAALEGASTESALRMYDFKNIPFAGGDGTHSILSVLFGAHSIGGGIFGYLNMKDSNKVRVQCVECRKAVMEFPWMDDESNIKGNIEAWRASFPCARAVNISGRRDLVDADFVHIRGDARVRLHTVNMSGCYKVTDAALVHLRGIHTLDIRYCAIKFVKMSERL
jgi:hypothetical protein